MVNCGGFHINKDKLKVIDGVLTKQESVSVTTKALAGCGGLVFDADVFKFNEETHALTDKDAESVTDTIFAPCGDLKLDTEYFEIDEDGKVTLKEVSGVDMLSGASTMSASTTTSITKVTFESLDEFNIVVKDADGNTVEPIEDKMYELERTKQYSYEATNVDNEIVSGTITTGSRQANVTKTIEF